MYGTHLANFISPLEVGISYILSGVKITYILKVASEKYNLRNVSAQYLKIIYGSPLTKKVQVDMEIWISIPSRH